MPLVLANISDFTYICANLGKTKSHALPVFHAVTGCDTTSVFKLQENDCMMYDRTSPASSVNEAREELLL